MQMVIYIDEKLYNDITTEGLYYSRAYEMGKAIENGVILPKEHGNHQPSRKGYWNDFSVDYWECSECKNLNKIDLDFCPNCGADMREGSK